MLRTLLLGALAIWGLGAAEAKEGKAAAITLASNTPVPAETAKPWEKPVIGAVRANGANQCFARARVPAEVDVRQVENVIVPARTETRVVPAVWGAGTRDASSPDRVEYVFVPGVYRTVTVARETAPAQIKTTYVPAHRETVSERVVVRPGYVTWRAGCGAGGALPISAGGDDQLPCKVETPAVYMDVSRTRLVPAARIETPVAAGPTETVTRQELVTPARMEARVIPGTKRTVKERRLVAPERTEVVTIPAVTRFETQTRVVRPERIEWREVLCEDKGARPRIKAVQRALAAHGYVVEADGAYGPATRAALERFQKERRIATGYLTLETMHALGVN